MESVTVGYQKPTLRLSKQAKEYLFFLAENKVNGTFEQSIEANSVNDVLLARNTLKHWYPTQNNVSGEFCRKAVSIRNFIRVTGKATVKDFDLGYGGTEVTPKTVLRSYERTVKNLLLKGLIDRFKQNREYHYFISDLGLKVVKAKEVS